MFRGERSGTKRISLREAGVFDEPGCCRFHPARPCGISRHRSTCYHLKLGKLLFRDDWILEKRSRASTIGIAFHQKHRFTCANPAHGCSNLAQQGIAHPAFELALDIGIADGRVAMSGQGIGHAENNVAVFGDSVEETAAVGETAVFPGEFDDRIGLRFGDRAEQRSLVGAFVQHAAIRVRPP